MAIDSFEFKIITGGFNHCDCSWNQTNDELNQCFKIYHPVKGSGIIHIDQKEYLIEEGNVYFISGFNIISQRCNGFMDIYWLHVVPVSLLLRRLLLHLSPFHVWKEEDVPFINDFDKYVKRIFQNEHYLSSKILIKPHSFEEAKLHSFTLSIIAEIIKDVPDESISISDEIKKLKPSIAFMNGEFLQNPSLEKIANQSNLAPNYFHRIFKKNFGLTPFNYMLKLRMEYAIKLLTTTNKSVKQVSYESGYKSEFYFSRQFKKHYKCSPGNLKTVRPF